MERHSGTEYDAMPYYGGFLPMTHPDRMATMAVLHGMQPPSVENCRVLELGCSDGGNLLAMAQSLPRATFLGVDLSPRQVAQGRATIREIGASNVELRALDLTEIDDSYGRFDYIICHGVYSWVAGPVRDKILAICSRNLAPGGIAYISYNTYPGWHLRGMLREMMRYHVGGIADPATRVQQARELLDFVIRSAPPQGGVHTPFLEQVSRKLEAYPDTYVFHEYLEEENHPVYFHEFAAHAASAGLRHLSHAEFDPEESRLSPDFWEIFDRPGGDTVRREQYVDFVLNRPFRQSLLCHAGLASQAGPTPGAVPSLRMAALARPRNPAPDLVSEAHEPFLAFRGNLATVADPWIKAALVALHRRYPRSLSFRELRAETLALLGRSEEDAGDDEAAFASRLLRCHVMQFLDMRTADPPIAGEPGERPRASPLARRNAAMGERVIGLRNHVAVLEETDLLVLPLLDGTRDRSAIVDGFAGAVATGDVKLRLEGRPLSDPAEVRAALGPIVESSLRRIAEQALLLAD